MFRLANCNFGCGETADRNRIRTLCNRSINSGPRGKSIKVSTPTFAISLPFPHAYLCLVELFEMLLIASLIAVTHIPSIFADCFSPNGTDRSINFPKGQRWVPCNKSWSSSNHSMCCNEASNDVCQENGLCLSPTGLLWRESCTDPTWSSPNCLKLCVGGDTSMIDDPFATAQMAYLWSR